MSIGNVSVDIKAFSYEEDGTEAYRDGTIDVVPGGVGRGMAINIAHLGLKTAIYSVVRKNIFGEYLHRSLEKEGIDTTLLPPVILKKQPYFRLWHPWEALHLAFIAPIF